jgi:hypothetical protein
VFGGDGRRAIVRAVDHDDLAPRERGERVVDDLGDGALFVARDHHDRDVAVLSGRRHVHPLIHATLGSGVSRPFSSVANS